jgi:hypothetical protein
MGVGTVNTTRTHTQLEDVDAKRFAYIITHLSTTNIVSKRHVRGLTITMQR